MRDVIKVIPWLWLCGCKAGTPMKEDSAPSAVLPEPAVDARLPFYAVVVPAELDGVERSFLLDSGADGLVLSTEVAEASAETADLRWGGRDYPGTEWTEASLQTESGLLGVELAGLLGGALMADRVVTVDYQASSVYPLQIWDDALDFGDVGDFDAVPFTLSEGVILASATFEDLPDPVTVIVDTGTTSAVISESLMSSIGADTDGRTLLVGSGAVSGSSTTDTTILRIRSMALGEVRSEEMWASVLDDRVFASIGRRLHAEVSAIVGGSFLRETVVGLDYGASTLRLAHAGDLSWITDEFRSAGLEIIQEDEGYFVYTVFRDSDAEAQGVTVGDTLLAVDGIPAAELSHADVIDHLRGEPGTSLTLTLSGEAGEREVSVLREDLLPLED